MTRRRWGWTALVSIVLIGAGLATWTWAKPYPLPTLPTDLTAQSTRLTFTRERETVRNQGSSAASLTQVAGLVSSKDPAQINEGIALLKQAVAKEPENLVWSNLLRQTLVREARYDELTQFVDSVQGESDAVHIVRALSLVDSLQNPALASASLGQLSLRSIQELDPVLEKDPHNWLARLCRGLNNLYWPIGLRRNEKAIADLSYAVAILEALPDQREPYLAIAYAGYGDALVKGEQIAEGVRVWKRGLERFPDDPDLKERVATGASGATALVERARGIDTFTRPPLGMTDLGRIWQGAPGGKP